MRRILHFARGMVPVAEILVTGFEPFGGSAINPSGEAARALDGSVVNGDRAFGVVLPVSWADSHGELYRAIEDVKPDVILCLGQSGRGFIALERIAINCCEGPDNEGVEGSGRPAICGAPDGLFSQLPLGCLKDAVNRAGIPAEISNSAGTYLCNYVMYGLLHYLREAGSDTLVAGFVHVPSLPRQVVTGKGRGKPSMSQDLINEAVRVMLRTLG